MTNHIITGRRRGSTLIEIAIVVVIVGVAGVALLEFLVSATRANATLSEHTIALNIARAGQEWAASRSPAELAEWFAANPTGRPGELLAASEIALVDTDAARQAAYNGWSEQLTLEQVNESDPTQADVAATRLMQITVRVSKGGAEHCSLTRLYANVN